MNEICKNCRYYTKKPLIYKGKELQTFHKCRRREVKGYEEYTTPETNNCRYWEAADGKRDNM